MKLTLSAAMFCATCIPSTGAANDTLACLQDKFLVEVTSTSQQALDDREITVAVTNNSGFPIGGIWIDFDIRSDKRPLPLYHASIREAATIDGGLLPGETITATDYHFMDERTNAMAMDADHLSITATVINVADVGMKGFFDHPSMASWSDGITEITCE